MSLDDTLELPAGCKVVAPKENQLALIVRDSGLEKTKAEVILHKFQDYFEMAAEWERKARSIVVTDEKQTDDMAMARTGRRLLSARRIEIEKTRKELKEQSLREGKAIDGIANVLKGLIVPIEEYLERQEKFVEFKVAAEEQRRLEEAEKLAAENEQKRLAAEAAEQARIRAENEKLRKEAAVRELKIAEERREQEKALAAERAKADAERKLAEQKAAAERKAQEELMAKERKAQEEKIAEERRKAEAERKIQEAKMLEDRNKAEAEIAKKNAELAKAKEIADKSRAEAERLRNQLTCPKCGHKFNKETKDGKQKDT
jgi:hypothetical protein